MSSLKKYQKIELKKIVKSRKFKVVLLGLAGLIILGLCYFGVYSIIFAKKIYAHQYISNTNYGGKTKSEATALLDQKSKEVLGSKIELVYQPEIGDKKIYEISSADINLQFDIGKTTDNLWSEGRKEGTLKSLLEQLGSMFVKKAHSMQYSVNDEALSLKIKGIADELDQPEKDFSLTYENGKFILNTERKEGKRINQVGIIGELKDKISKLDKGQISFTSEAFKPQVDEEKANAALGKANRAIESGEISLKYGNQQFKVDEDTIGGFIKSKTNGDDLEIAFNDDRIKSYVDSIAGNIDVQSQNAKLTISGGKATVYQAATVGRSLDREQTKIDIENLLNARMNSDKSTNVDLATINLKVATKDPEITEQKINQLGIVELVGSAETTFNGSPSNRIHNIQVGASAINGVLLKPGETFSTLKQLGKIDASSGYLEELVIKENSTVPEFGGGLCQVSSTLFRAVLNAGLKIVERQNHKYRVSYYEPPVGMDATIYDPAPDFKFQNDYGSYLLIQSKVVGTKITFEIYGTKDGRKSEVSDSVVTDVTQPPAPSYTETETLAPGVKKKIDSAHPGATARFHYKVTRGSQVLEDRDFVSKYVPWQEKWLIGKGTPAPEPTPTPTPTPDPAPAPASEPTPPTETTPASNSNSNSVPTTPAP